MAARGPAIATKSAAAIDVFADVSAPCAALARRDRALKTALAAIGKPHIRRRPGGFEALFRIIVEQQVSVASARAIWTRCQAGVACAEPDDVIGIGIDGLRALGLSRPKSGYVFGLAEAAARGGLDFPALARMDDAAAAKSLKALKGVGPWTAGIYLLFCEGRPDIWPPGDIALQYAFGAAEGRDSRISGAELDARATGWAPFRGVAAHILWTYYAHLRGRTPI